MGALDGKTAVITGAGAGIGAAYSHHLAALGALIVAADIDEAAAKAVADEIVGAGGRAVAAAVDVADEDSVGALVTVAAAHGGADVVVNNAALYNGMPMGPVEHMAVADWRRMMEVNVTGVFIVCKAFIPQLRANAGVIVNQSSTAAYMAAPTTAHYAVSKSAVVSLTRNLAAELGPDGVRVNAIAPGYTTTEATLNNFAARTETSAAAAALRRNGTTADLVGALEFLVSPASSWMTGQTLVVDGGRVFPQ